MGQRVIGPAPARAATVTTALTTTGTRGQGAARGGAKAGQPLTELLWARLSFSAWPPVTRSAVAERQSSGVRVRGRRSMGLMVPTARASVIAAAVSALELATVRTGPAPTLSAPAESHSVNAFIAVSM